VLSIVISAAIAFGVAYATSKRCFDKIDGYVKDVTEELYAALDKLTVSQT